MAQFLEGLDTMGQFYKENATGLGQGLASLAQSKVNQMKQERLKKGLGAIPGMTPEMADAYAGLPPDLLKELIRSKTGASEARQVAREDQIRKHYSPQVQTLLQKEKNLRGILEAAQSEGGRTFMGAKGIGEWSQWGLPKELQKLKGYSDELLIQEQAEAARNQGGRSSDALRKQVESGKLGLHLPPDELIRRAQEKLAETEKRKNSLFSTYPFLKDSPEIEELMESSGGQQQNLGQQVAGETAEKTPGWKERFRKQLSNDGLSEKVLTTKKSPAFETPNGALYVWNKNQNRYVKTPKKGAK